MERSKPGSDDRSITGSDFLQLVLDEAPTGGLSDWLTVRLREAIADGRLPVGSKLPPTRLLAAELRVSRGVVTEAYQRLIEDGHAEGRARAGTVVLAAPLVPAQRSTSNPAPNVFAGELGEQVFEALRQAPARIDLSPGVPDLAAFPRTSWLRAERAVLGGMSPHLFGYGDPRGVPAFRQAVASWLGRYRGVGISADEVVVVAGVAQALALLADVLRSDGIGVVAVEDPGSLGARQQLQSMGLQTPPVAVDDGGLRVPDLVAGGAPAVLMTPAHQFPTGVVLDGRRRRELVTWAEAGGLVIEDDYDAEHRYDRPPVAALRSLLPDRVCYTGSVSKILAPALRIGWAVVPRRYHDGLVAAKRRADLGNAVLPQLVMAELMASGAMERHLRQVRRRHRRRRDAMIHALGAQLPEASVHGAAAGLHVTVTFDELDELDDTALAAAVLDLGVKVQPLSWHRQRPGRPGLVLGYAARSAGEIVEGVELIAVATRQLAHSSPSRSKRRARTSAAR
jgi:GntR family transcriptional regulator/MocR family aminotransferase